MELVKATSALQRGGGYLHPCGGFDLRLERVAVVYRKLPANHIGVHVVHPVVRDWPSSGLPSTPAGRTDFS